jgi:hypothetical protein
MRPPILALATALLVPVPAAAQELDIGKDADAPVLETEDTAPSAGATLGDLEDQVNSGSPLALEPKFDLTDEQPDTVSGTSPLDHSEPQPAPGFVLKIPTE